MKQYRILNFHIYEFCPLIPSTKCIFFAHANAIPAQTYKSLFEKIAAQFNFTVIAYDMRGIGKTSEPPLMTTKDWGWNMLIEDHKRLFEQIKLKNPHLHTFVLAGHSLGAWVSLFAAPSLNLSAPLLIDPPILAPSIVLKWFLIFLLRQKELNPNSIKVKKRKTRFINLEKAVSQYAQSSFMKNWPRHVIEDYIAGSFSQHEQGLLLRHNPLWEAYLFESYPPFAAVAFLKMPRAVRKKLTPIFLVGEKSDACHLRAKNWVKLFFPHLTWSVIDEGSHMFPFEKEEATLKYLSNIFDMKKQNQCSV